MKSYNIHFIRHGITLGNEQGRYIGRTDMPLSAGGVRMLKEQRAKSPYPKAQAYFSSPLKRCVETLNIFYPGEKPIIINDFRECDFGAWEGKTAAEISAEDDNFKQWIAGNGKAVTPPGGESGGVFMQRVCAAFEKVVDGMLRSGTTSAVIVTHGGVIMSILSTYGLPKAEFYEWMTQNGCGYSMRITPGIWMRSMVGEVYAEIPSKSKNEDDDGKIIIDIAREAAQRAFGKKEDKKSKP